MLTFTLETITPSEAARILTEHDKLVKSGEIINRPRMPATWRKYQADLSNGRWYAETAEPLKFETLDQHLQGKNLIDGQNRLEACVRAGVNLEVYVARNVARRAFSYIDGGVPRNLATKLTIRGEELTPQQTTWLAAALKHLCRWDEANGKITNSPVTDQACIYLLESDPAIRKSLAKAQAVWEQRLIGVGAATFLHRIFSRHDPDLANRFIDVLSREIGLDDGDPFATLKRALILNKGSRRKIKQADVIAMSIKVWNAKRHGREIKKLTGGKKNAEMPVLEAVEPASASNSGDAAPEGGGLGATI